eukprot:758995-Hanusia_phi.AAC.1
MTTKRNDNKIVKSSDRKTNGNQGARTKKRVLSADMVRAIYAERSTKEGYKSLESVVVANRYGISSKTVRDIWNHRTWVDVTKPLWNCEDMNPSAASKQNDMKDAEMRELLSQSESKLSKQKTSELVPGVDQDASSTVHEKRSNSISPFNISEDSDVNKSMRESSEERTVQSFLNLESDSNSGSSASVCSSHRKDSGGKIDRYLLRSAKRKSSPDNQEGSGLQESDLQSSSSDIKSSQSGSFSSHQSKAPEQPINSSSGEGKVKSTRRKGGTSQFKDQEARTMRDGSWPESLSVSGGSSDGDASSNGQSADSTVETNVLMASNTASSTSSDERVRAASASASASASGGEGSSTRSGRKLSNLKSAGAGKRSDSDDSPGWINRLGADEIQCYMLNETSSDEYGTKLWLGRGVWDRGGHGRERGRGREKEGKGEGKRGNNGRMKQGSTEAGVD